MSQVVLSVTAEQVTAWEKEIEEIKARQERDGKRLQTLTLRLQSLHLFDDDTAQRTIAPIAPEREPIPSQGDVLALSPPSLVLRLLEKQGVNWTTIGELKAKILEIGYPEKKFGPGYRYLYSLLPRLVKSGKIKKDGNKLMLLPRRTTTIPGGTS